MSHPSNAEIDAIYTAVGEALDAWSRVEHALEHFFADLTTADTWDAHLIMSSVVSFDARLRICNSLMGRHRNFPDMLERWNPLFNKLDRKYRKRNDLAHFSVIQQNAKIILIPYWSTGKTMRQYVETHTDGIKPLPGLSAEEIRARAKSFRQLAHKVLVFSTDLKLAREQLREVRAQANDQGQGPDQNDHSPTEHQDPPQS